MGFLGKARKMIGGGAAQEPPRPQYYQVACIEGHVIRGERTEGYQALRCPHCSDGIFVLPRSPLPLPPAPGSARPKHRAAAPALEDRPIELADAPPQEDLEEIQWIDGGAAPVAARARSSPGGAEAQPILEAVAAETAEVTTRARRPKASAPARPRRPDPEDDDPQASAVVGRGKVLVPTRTGRRAPIAGIALGVALIVGVTIGYRLWRQRLQELPHEAEVNRVEGVAALEKGQFDEARKRLGKSASAYRALGATDEAALSAIQLADEADVLASLSRDPLKEIVEEVARLGDPEGIAKFDLIHKGQAVLIDSEVLDTSGGAVQLALRIFVGRGPTPAKQGQLDLAGFRLFEGATMPKKGDRAFFGAKLGSIRLENGVWKVGLAPESGVLMTNQRALQAAAMGPPVTVGATP